MWEPSTVWIIGVMGFIYVEEMREESEVIWYLEAKSQEDVHGVMDKAMEDEKLEKITYFRTDSRSLMVNVGWGGDDSICPYSEWDMI